MYKSRQFLSVPLRFLLPHLAEHHIHSRKIFVWVRKIITTKKFVGKFYTLFKKLEEMKTFIFINTSQSQFYVI